MMSVIAGTVSWPGLFSYAYLLVLFPSKHHASILGADEGLLELFLYSFPYGVMLAKTLACFSALLG